MTKAGDVSPQLRDRIETLSRALLNVETIDVVDAYPAVLMPPRLFDDGGG